MGEEDNVWSLNAKRTSESYVYDSWCTYKKLIYGCSITFLYFKDDDVAMTLMIWSVGPIWTLALWLLPIHSAQ